MSDFTTINTTIGLLGKLEGSWEGSGFNMLAVPNPKAKPGEPPYRIIAQAYKETIVFNEFTGPGEGVPNRKLDETQFISALEYTQNVTAIDETTGEEVGIHHENGLWLMLDDTVEPNRIARQSSVPHGNSLLALGKVFTVAGGPQFDDVCVLPPNATNKDYLKPYFDAEAKFKALGIDFLKPNNNLIKANDGLNITQTTVYEVDTNIAGGGVLNIPFFKPAPVADLGDAQKVKNFIETPALKSTFWVNTVVAEDGTESLQLQYSQDTTIKFFKSAEGDELIIWPHFDVATMKKV